MNGKRGFGMITAALVAAMVLAAGCGKEQLQDGVTAGAETGAVLHGVADQG